MQKIRPISKNVNKLLTFENLDKMKFCHTLTYENRRNLLNFLDTGLIFGFSPLFVCSAYAI